MPGREGQGQRCGGGGGALSPGSTKAASASVAGGGRRAHEVRSWRRKEVCDSESTWEILQVESKPLEVLSRLFF